MAAKLEEPQPATVSAVLRSELLELENAMRDALELELVGRSGGEGVEEQHRAIAFAEVLLERQDLSTVAQRVPCEQPHLGKRVEHDPQRLHPVHLREHRPGRLGQLHFGRVEEGVLRLGLEALLRALQIADRDAVERPAVALRDGAQLRLVLGASRNCSASVVFPEPGGPETR